MSLEQIFSQSGRGKLWKSGSELGDGTWAEIDSFQTLQHHTTHRQLHHRFAGGFPVLIVFAQTAVIGNPG
jgi:hypothetical protein